MRRESSVSITVALLVLALIINVDSKKNKVRDPKTKSESKAPVMDSMICPTCDRLFCTVRKASRLQCPGGKTTDICGCCPVCAKQVGDPCGGEWNYLGKCDVGLYCKASTVSIHAPILFQDIKPVEVPKGGIAEGTCVQCKYLTLVTLTGASLFSYSQVPLLCQSSFAKMFWQSFLIYHKIVCRYFSALGSGKYFLIVYHMAIVL